ncbi:MAG: GNAT family N-acetyltransferase [Chloroflexota bacterium]
MDVDPARPNRNNSIVILPLDPDYIPQVLQTYLTGYDIDETWLSHPDVMTAEKFALSLEHFPEGQYMAFDAATDRVVGMSSSMIIDYDISQPLMKPWRKTTAGGALTTHNPRGNWLYGVDCVVLPEYRGKGVGGRLIKARFDVVKRRNLHGMIAGSMPIDYHLAAAEGVTIEDYVADVVAGRRWDTNLSKQIKKGFRVRNIIPNYLTDTPETLDYAVAIVRENDAYRAPAARPVTAIRQPQATRPYRKP